MHGIHRNTTDHEHMLKDPDSPDANPNPRATGFETRMPRPCSSKTPAFRGHVGRPSNIYPEKGLLIVDKDAHYTLYYIMQLHHAIT